MPPRTSGMMGDLMHRVLAVQLVDDHGASRLVIGGEALGLGVTTSVSPGLLITFIMASWRSAMVMKRLSDRAASRAASLSRFSRSAPVKPAVALARSDRRRPPPAAFPGVDLQGSPPAPDVRQPHIDLPVKAAGRRAGSRMSWRLVAP